METLFSEEKKGVLRLIFLNTKSIHNCTKIWALVEWHFLQFDFFKYFISKRKYIYTVNKKNVNHELNMFYTTFLINILNITTI